MREVRRSRRHAFARGTFSNLRTQFRSYFAFCVYFRRKPLPANLDTVCGFAQFLSRSITSNSIRNYLSGIKMLHILLGYEYNFTDDLHLQLVLRGIGRMKPHVPRRARPVTPAILSAFHGCMDQSSSLHWTVFACSLVLFFTMARLGSVLPSSEATPNKLFLLRKCMNFSREGMLVTILHTKTIQFGERRLHIPLVRMGSHLCPVSAYRRSLGFLSSGVQVPAFVVNQDGVNKRLTKSLFVSTFREVLRVGGDEDAMGFTGHSFRRGGASWAFRAGIPGEIIQVCGDWSSDAYKRYLEFSIENRIQIASVFAGSLL